MLISKTGKLKWNNKNKKYYLDKGYTFTHIGEEFDVAIQDLTNGSHAMVDVSCDYCGKIVQKRYMTYLKQHHDKFGDCCKECQSIKNQLCCLEKYGVDNGSKTKEAILKIKQTSLERYGYEHTLQVPSIREKGMKTLSANHSCPTSKQQIVLCDILKELYGACELNHPCGNCFLDCVIEINGDKIDIEYDGAYWHQDEQRDRKRDEFVKSQGYKVLRIVGGHKVPTKEQIVEAIDYLVKGNHSFNKINLNI